MNLNIASEGLPECPVWGNHVEGGYDLPITGLESEGQALTMCELEQALPIGTPISCHGFPFIGFRPFDPCLRDLSSSPDIWYKYQLKGAPSIDGKTEASPSLTCHPDIPIPFKYYCRNGRALSIDENILPVENRYNSSSVLGFSLEGRSRQVKVGSRRIAASSIVTSTTIVIRRTVISSSNGNGFTLKAPLRVIGCITNYLIAPAATWLAIIEQSCAQLAPQCLFHNHQCKGFRINSHHLTGHHFEQILYDHKLHLSQLFSSFLANEL